MISTAKEKLTVGTRWYLATEAVNGLSAIAGVAIFTRLVSPEIYGSYSVIMAAAGMGLSLAVEWLQFSTMRLLPGVRRPENEWAFIRALLLLAVTSLFLVSIVGSGLAVFVFDSGADSGLIAGWWYMASGVFFMSGTTIFQARLRPLPFSILRSGFAVFRVMFGYLLLTRYEASELSLVGGNVVALLVLLLMVAYFLWPRVGAQWARSLVWGRRILAFGSPMIGWFLASQVLNVSDRFLIKWYGTNFDVGQYTVTYALVVAVITASLQPILAAAFPVIVRSMELRGEAAAGDHLNRVLHIFFLLVPPMLVGLMVFGAEIISILADKSYQTPRSLISTLALAIVLWNLGLYLQKVLELRLASVKLLYVLVVAAATNVGANLILIPAAGIQGAAISTVVGYSTYCLGILKVTNRPLTGLISRHLLLSLLLGGAVMGAFMVGVGALLKHFHVLIRLAAAGGGSIIFYALIINWRGELNLLKTGQTE